jgi:GTPase SAR1 family protein
MHTKVLILGRERVGKTSFAHNLNNNFRKDHIPTIGASVNKINDIIYWDISENFNTIDDTFYENSDFAIVMFDITFVPSFKGVRYYVDKVKRLSPSCKIILVGNKYDLARSY